MAPRWLCALSAATWHGQHAVAAPHEATPPLAVVERAEHGHTFGSPPLAQPPGTASTPSLHRTERWHTQHAVAAPHERESAHRPSPRRHIYIVEE